MATTPAERRAELAAALARAARLTSAQVEASGLEASADASFCDALVEAFVDMGGYSHPLPAVRMVRLEDLDGLPAAQELEDALDRRRGQLPFENPQRLRLGKLYALAGRHEKAASCFREVLASPEPPPMALVIELAEAAARAGQASLALAGVDRVAETILTRDPTETVGEDLLRDDPLTAGAMLERARDIALRIDQAPRAVALGRAATSLYERLGRAAEIRGSLAGQVEALLASGNARKSRLTAERWRDLSRDSGAPVDEAAAQTALAEQDLARGQLGRAASLLGDVADIHDELEDRRAAALAHERQSQILLQDGLIADARLASERGREQAAQAQLGDLVRQLAAQRVRVDLADGLVGEALRAAEALRAEHLAAGDSLGAARAAVLVAEARMLAGDGAGALAALLDGAADMPAGLEQARALRIQAEVALLEGRRAEARLLLFSAGRLASSVEAWEESASAIVRRGELALEDGDEPAARAAMTEAERLAAQGRVELQLELLQARLAEQEEGELLLEELADTVRGGLPEQIKIHGALRAIGRGLDMLGNDASAPLVERLRAVRDTLPESLRAGFLASPLCQPLMVGEGDPLAPLRQV